MLERGVLYNSQFYTGNIGKWYLHLGNKLVFHDSRKVPARCVLLNIFIGNLD